MYDGLRGQEAKYFWTAVIYMVMLAIAVSRSFVMGSMTGVFSLVLSWFIWGEMMPGHQLLMTLICGLAFAPIFLIFNGVQEGRINGERARSHDMSSRLHKIAGISTGKVSPN